jgi:Uma2 family endonuclease
MSLALKYRPHYTFEDYKKWQGDWELVEGIPYALASPDFWHQRTIIKITSQIDTFITENCLNCHVAIDLDWIISEDTVLRPDIVVFCDEPMERLTKTPRIIFEIVSKSSIMIDEGLKFEIYQKEGVEYYVLVYPETKDVVCYKYKDGAFIKDQTLKEGLLSIPLTECPQLLLSPPIFINFSKVWSS